MKNVRTLIPILVLTFATAHAAAVDSDAQEKPDSAEASPYAPSVMTTPGDDDAMRGLEAPAAGPAQQKTEAPDPAYTPYMTYDGATTSNSDR